MPILNYTTTISPDKSVAEISRRLVSHGATHIMIEYGGDKVPSGLAFNVGTEFGDRHFRLPAHIEGVEAALVREVKKRTIPKSKACREHAARVAWRVLKDWVEVQLAIVEAGLVTVDEVMLPYLVLRGDRTVYQAMAEQRLALPGPG